MGTSLGYLTTSNKKGRADSFYSRPEVDFSSVHYNLDFDTRGTIAIGEALTTVKIYNSTSYTSPVYILTGQQDALFCGNGSRTIGTPDCGSGATSQLAAVKMFYPAVPASNFDYYAQPDSGHSLQQHYCAVKGFAKVRRCMSLSTPCSTSLKIAIIFEQPCCVICSMSSVFCVDNWRRAPES